MFFNLIFFLFAFLKMISDIELFYNFLNHLQNFHSNSLIFFTSFLFHLTSPNKPNKFLNWTAHETVTFITIISRFVLIIVLIVNHTQKLNRKTKRKIERG